MRVALALLLLASGVSGVAGSRKALPAKAKPAPARKQSAKDKAVAKKRVVKKRSPPKQMAPTRDRIIDIQEALAGAGSYRGAPTGQWDAASTEAMTRFQSSHGLTPTGKINALTLDRLGLGSQTAGRGAPLARAPATPASGNSATTP